MKERSELLEFLRGEIVGPGRPVGPSALIHFDGLVFRDQEQQRRGGLAWKSEADAEAQEVLYYQRENPYRKYGAGILHPPVPTSRNEDGDAVRAAAAGDAVGVDDGRAAAAPEPAIEEGEIASEAEAAEVEDVRGGEPEEDFEVTSPDIRRPSTIGISFCAHLKEGGQIEVKLPRSRRFGWQPGDARPIQLNGLYQKCERLWTDTDNRAKKSEMWRRLPAVPVDATVVYDWAEIARGRLAPKTVTTAPIAGFSLQLDLFARPLKGQEDVWLITLVLRNTTAASADVDLRTCALYQTYFEVRIRTGALRKYPESQRPFEMLDRDEQSLALLYRESATWGIGHGCAAGWDAEPGHAPDVVWADVMPSVELPSMTPDICDEAGAPIQLSMRALSALPSPAPENPVWAALIGLADGYERWIAVQKTRGDALPTYLRTVADRHLDGCKAVLRRIRDGVALLQADPLAREAFRLANLAMLLQQIAAKKLKPRLLEWNTAKRAVVPGGAAQSPWNVYEDGIEGDLGRWRAFQIAFLLMSLPCLVAAESPDRSTVDLIWFPTGGGKTEAYLGVMSFYMFHQRLLMRQEEGDAPGRDGTNALMRYTLRMLTTQQFQRAASLICAMEFIRRRNGDNPVSRIPGRRFSLGLWIGGEATPNSIREAQKAVKNYRKNGDGGNPLVLTDCPWCRAQIGQNRELKKPPQFRGNDKDWNLIRTGGIGEVGKEPLLVCTDAACAFGAEASERWLPVEVIDERIYALPPSLIIATADKFAMLAYRPEAGRLFGRGFKRGQPVVKHMPPGLIIQDELHLISGPLGTVYGLYEPVFERLCSIKQGEHLVRPKIIASTATIRGADEQVISLYGRPKTQLFPPPGLSMSDSFFGTYARDDKGRLRSGRLYLGVHAGDYGSVLTTQVRAFAALLCRPAAFGVASRDPWWTLLAFFNSIRELGGARTLFDSDIRSRLRFLCGRENLSKDNTRTIRKLEELTARLSQSEIVEMLDRLAADYERKPGEALDACLASNIIEVGVDIDRLSLLGVVGQPKTTAQYIQVTGRVGRRWWERPGLILMVYNPSKSRDRSHFEQFHSYHRRLYERVEPTSATPFAGSTINRALAGVLIAWARQQSEASVFENASYEPEVRAAEKLLEDRCIAVQLDPSDQKRSLAQLRRISDRLLKKWQRQPQQWEGFPPDKDGHYLMLWPGQYASAQQRSSGETVLSSMRQVDGSGELDITSGYLPAMDELDDGGC